MSVNKYKKHLLILPEDDANRQIALGFILDPGLDERAVQILPPSGGWSKAVESFEQNHATKMRSYPKRAMLLLIDFDNDENRSARVKTRISGGLIDRVFILGTKSEAEDLKRAFAQDNSFEDIGKKLAEDCANQVYDIWRHKLLEHNRDEL